MGTPPDVKEKRSSDCQKVSEVLPMHASPRHREV